MSMTTLLVAALALAVLPTALIVVNLAILKPPPPLQEHPPLREQDRVPDTSSRLEVLGGASSGGSAGPRVSVLIPARNEEEHIGGAVDSVLADGDPNLEVIVLDDGSDDGTAPIVREAALRDRRVSLRHGQPVPEGFCGKPFACLQLAQAAKGEVLVFMDADVRLAPDAVPRLAAQVERGDAALLSGVPLQITGSFAEKLVVPLIHFVLLGYLPIAAMRLTTWPPFGAGCGQLVVVRRADYLRIGGHAAVASSMNDGVTLPRAFRRHGLRTDLVDITKLATCRMYGDWDSVLHGFAKNAHEGLGGRYAIVPWTLLLLGGQTLPLLALPWLRDAQHVGITAAAVLAAYAGRLLLAVRFESSRAAALFHPLGVAVLVGIQWYALARRALQRPVTWKDRVTTELDGSR